VPLRTLLFGFGIILDNPQFVTCYDVFEKIFIFNVFKKVQAYIPSVFLLFVGEVFGTSFAQIFCMPNSSVKMLWMVG